MSTKIVGRPRLYDRDADAERIKPWLDQGIGYKRAGQILGWKPRRAQTAAEIARGVRDSGPWRSPPKLELAPAPEPKATKEPRKPVRIGHIQTIDRPIQPGIVTRVIITSAQDDTPVFEPFWTNLQSYAEYLDASISVGGYTYQLGLYEDHAIRTGVFAEELRDYLLFDRVAAGDVLIVSDANVLPTTANPLQGWLTANRGDHVVIPHARVALQSIPRMMSAPPRYCISTGTVTRPSYTPRAAGRKALFHHTYGALLIEWDTDGEVFFRHLLADEDGSFQDLNNKVVNGRVETGHAVAAIAWGDIHHEQLDPAIARASWGYDTKVKRLVSGHDSILDTLYPSIQVLHDTLDFRRRNHHDLHDPHRKAQVLRAGSGSVEEEVREAAGFVRAIARDWCQTVVVESNHDAALAKWLKNSEGSEDPVNAEYWHAMNSRWHRAIRLGRGSYNVVEDAFRRAGVNDNVAFVPSGATFQILGIEHGLHGDLGVGGSRGSPQQYRRLGPKVTSAHTHTPLIVNGVYVAGVSAALDQGYNRGPTTWAHAHVVLYDNGKRCLLHMTADGRWRAGMGVEEYRLAA